MQAVISAIVIFGVFLSFQGIASTQQAPIQENLSSLFEPLLEPASIAQGLQKAWDEKDFGVSSKALNTFERTHKKSLKKIEQKLAKDLTIKGEVSPKTLSAVDLWSLVVLMRLNTEQNSSEFKRLLVVPVRLSFELSYANSTSDQLRWGFRFRERFLNFVKRKLEDKAQILMGRDSLEGLSGVSWTWPLDRMLVQESRVLVPQAAWPLSQKITLEIQKNPYQSISELMKKKSWESQSLKNWSLVWTDQDVKNLRGELTFLSQLRLQWAVLRFKAEKKVNPKGQEDLIQSGYLGAKALDYFTGLPLPVVAL